MAERPSMFEVALAWLAWAVARATLDAPPVVALRRDRFERLRRRRRPGHADPVPERQFRLMMLDDEPYPTYIGTRAWCDGTAYWSDRSCRCAHTEEAPA